jgi:hypothetical protein
VDDYELIDVYYDGFRWFMDLYHEAVGYVQQVISAESAAELQDGLARGAHITGKLL